jgi:lysozyme family protein
MYSEVFYEIIEDVIEKEGGYVNDPDDPGGETKYGISKKAFPKEDIKNLTIVRAKDIYYTKYWKPSKAYLIPDELQHIYFDMCVNFGIIGAGKVLQRALMVESAQRRSRQLKTWKQIDSERIES